VPCTLDGLGHFTLKLQRVSGETAWSDLALFIDETHQVVRIFVVYVFDTVLFEAAVFLFDQTYLVRSNT